MKHSSLANVVRHILKAGVIRNFRRRYRNLLAIVNNPCLRLYSNVSIYQTKINGYVTVYDNVGLHGCEIGSMTYIQSNSIILNCKIGSYCSIAHNVKIGLGLHPTKTFVSTHPAFYSTICPAQLTFVSRSMFTEFKTTTIGSDVLIGCGTIILDGVKIGDGAIIGAGSVVTKNVEPYSIVAGSPARHLRYRFSSEQIELLLKDKWYEKDAAWILENHERFLSVEEFLNI